MSPCSRSIKPLKKPRCTDCVLDECLIQKLLSSSHRGQIKTKSPIRLHMQPFIAYQNCRNRLIIHRKSARDARSSLLKSPPILPGDFFSLHRIDRLHGVGVYIAWTKIEKRYIACEPSLYFISYIGSSKNQYFYFFLFLMISSSKRDRS